MLIDQLGDRHEALEKAERLNNQPAGGFCPLINGPCNPDCVCYRHYYSVKDLPLEEDGGRFVYGVFKSSGSCHNPMLRRGA